MTTNQIDQRPHDVEDTTAEIDVLAQNLKRIEELSGRVVAAISHQRSVPMGLQGPAPDLYVKASTAYMTEMMSNPGKLLEHQITWWSKTLKHHTDANRALLSGNFAAPEDNTGRDKRFSGELWDRHPYFNYIKQQYLLCLLYTSPSPRDQRGSRMPSSA